MPNIGHTLQVSLNRDVVDSTFFLKYIKIPGPGWFRGRFPQDGQLCPIVEEKRMPQRNIFITICTLCLLNIQGYIKATHHFIELDKDLSVLLESLFFTIDVESLYTNIDIPAGLATVRRFFQKFPDRKRPDKEILKLLEINLKCKDFEFIWGVLFTN